MTRQWIKIATALFGIIFGVCIGFLILFNIKKQPYPYNHPINKTFGIHKPQIIGFLPFWLVNKAKLDYRPYITTLTYFGLTINADGTVQKQTKPGENEPGWNLLKSSKLKEMLIEAKNNGLTLSLLVHLANENAISSLLEKPEKHAANLMMDVEPVMRTHGFTDLNLDIESFKTASASDQGNFTRFLSAVRSELESRQLGTLTIDISPSIFIRSMLIDPKILNSIADNVVVMAYDYHYAGSFMTGPVAPLEGAGISSEYDVKTTVALAEKYISSEKLILGLPLYGYEWETIRPGGSKVIIPGSGRSVSYITIMSLIRDCSNCVLSNDSLTKSKLMSFPENDYFRTTYYEDESIIEEKLKLVDKWSGAALWALGYEEEELLKPLKTYKSTSSLVW